jgi:hypothetical protein
MAGGTGGAGGGSNGIAGESGSTSTGYATGGKGGNNGVVLVDGTTSFGPYGVGANGANSDDLRGKEGNDGAVIITWGGGLEGSTVKYTAPTIVTVTSTGVGSGGGGPTGTPGAQPNITGAGGVALNYAPISRYWKANSTGDTSFAWNRALGFRCNGSNISTAELNNWGFDVADVAYADNIYLDKFSAGVDGNFAIGYAIIQHATTSISQSNFITLGMLSDSIPDRHTRSSDSNPYSDGSFPYGKGPWVIPTPGVNEFVYLWVSDTSGSDTRSVTVTYTAQ